MSFFNFAKNVTITRRGYDITLPKKVYDGLCENGYRIQAIVKKSVDTTSISIQLVHGKAYAGTLKKAMGVVAFKNGNCCDFREKNIIR